MADYQSESERTYALRKKYREDLARRNMAAMQPQPLPMGPRAAAMLAKMNGPQPSQASVAPEEPPPSAIAMGHSGGISEVGQGLDPEVASRIQRGFAQRALRDKRLGENSQGNIARARAHQLSDMAGLINANPNATTYEKMLAANGGRPSRAANNEMRRMMNLQRMKEFQMAAIQPALEMAKIQHGMTPLQQAMANQHNAAANYYNQMAQGNQPGAAGGPPGSPGSTPAAPAAPAEPFRGVGVNMRKHGNGVYSWKPQPWNIFDMYGDWMNNGGFFGPAMQGPIPGTFGQRPNGF